MKYKGEPRAKSCLSSLRKVGQQDQSRHEGPQGQSSPSATKPSLGFYPFALNKGIPFLRRESDWLACLALELGKATERVGLRINNMPPYELSRALSNTIRQALGSVSYHSTQKSQTRQLVL